MKSITVIKRCWNEEKDNKKLWVCSALFVLVVPIMKMVAAFLPQAIYNTIESETFSLLILLIAIEGILLCVDQYLKAQLNYLRVDARSNQMKKLISLFQEMPYEYIEDKEFDDEIQYAYNSLANPNGYEMVLKSTIDILGSFISLCIFSLILSKVNFWIVPLIMIALFVIGYVAFNSYEDKKEQFQSMSQMNRQKEYWNKVAYDYEQGKDIRLYHLLKPIQKYYESANQSYIQKYKELQKIDFKSHLFIDLLRIALVSFIFYEIFYGIENHTNFLFYSGIGLTVFVLTADFMESFLKLIDGVANVSGYFLFIDKYKIEKNAKQLSFQTLELKNVSFQYRNKSDLALKDIHLIIEKGDRIAIIGENGAGKSTLIKLLSGIYAPTNGKVLLNGQQASVEDLTKLVSTFHQDYHIYAASLKENIVAKEKMEQEKLSELSSNMDIDSLKEKKKINFESQLRKELYDDGTELSGGETEKVATARSFYQDKDVLILDEPFSALDMNHIQRTMQYIEHFPKDKTILIISHHFVNMSFYNKIIFLKDGQITEVGTHEELMDKKGDYYSIYQKQVDSNRMNGI